jgi:hypothetical protein
VVRLPNIFLAIKVVGTSIVKVATMVIFIDVVGIYIETNL